MGKSFLCSKVADKAFLYERIKPADTSLLFQLTNMRKETGGFMCQNKGERCAELLMHPAVMFMNSNKSAENINRIMYENRQKCREAVNMLIRLLLNGQYDTVVVENMTDITEDEADLEEFMKDAAKIGVGFLELSTMQYYLYEEAKSVSDKVIPIWDGGAGC